MRHFSILLIALALAACTAQQIQQTVKTVDSYLKTETPLTESQVIEGLKEALVQGAGSSTSLASKLDGYYKNPQLKIPFPPEVKKVEDKLRSLGMGSQVDEFVMTLNRGAENAAIEAKPIFVEAIKGMTVQDAWGILKGEENAATNYLKSKTYSQLQDKFRPVMNSALDKSSATKYYGDIVNTYNKIPFIEKVNPNLEEYATAKALDGLFLLVAQEEKNIRQDPVARTTELLKKVFAQQD